MSNAAMGPAGRWGMPVRLATRCSCSWRHGMHRGCTSTLVGASFRCIMVEQVVWTGGVLAGAAGAPGMHTCPTAVDWQPHLEEQQVLRRCTYAQSRMIGVAAKRGGRPSPGEVTRSIPGRFMAGASVDVGHLLLVVRGQM